MRSIRRREPIYPFYYGVCDGAMRSMRLSLPSSGVWPLSGIREKVDPSWKLEYIE